MSKVQWQETILHEGTEEERDAAFLAFKSNKQGQHFVFGGPRTDTAPAKPSSKSSKPSAKERVADLNQRMKEARERAAKGNHPSRKTEVPSSPKPPAAKGELAEANEAIKAFMGHSPK